MKTLKEYRYNYKGSDQGHYTTNMEALFNTITKAIDEGKTVEVRHWKNHTEDFSQSEPSGKRHIIHIYSPEGIDLINEEEKRIILYEETMKRAPLDISPDMIQDHFDTCPTNHTTPEEVYQCIRAHDYQEVTQ